MLAKSIIDFYDNKNIFITGATGLVGKSIIEKLLRVCRGVRCIYVLIRPKKGASVAERLENLLSSELFELIRHDNPNLLNKIKVFEGNLTDANFGLSNNDLQELITNVSIVIHAAAAVRFHEPLKLATEMNVIPVIKMLEICYQMKNLEIFIHISTAYANCDMGVVHEYVYPPSIDPFKVVDMVQCLDEDLLNLITPGLLKSKPNTYTFTKQLAECIIHENIDKLPIVIVRPSIIGASVTEPFPGWIDNFNAATGLIAAISKGMLRSMMGDYNKSANIIPVDTTANFILAAGWYSAGTYGTKLLNGNLQIEDSDSSEFDTKNTVVNNYNQNHSDTSFIPVFNCTLENDKLTWGTFVKALLPRVQHNPSISCQRFPNFHMTTASWYHDLKWTFSHMIPAAFLDLLQLAQGQSPKYMRGMDRLKDTVVRLSYFTLNHWHFDCNNKSVVWRAMCEADKKNFNFELSNIDWVAYLNVYHHGTKKYALKENTNIKSFSRGKRLRICYFGFRYLSMIAVLLFMMRKIHVFNGIFYQLLKILVRIIRLMRVI